MGEPKKLSFFDVLFTGMGIKCEPLSAEEAASKTVYDEFNRCCAGFSSMQQSCMQLLEMMFTAIGHRALKEPGGADKYYTDFSEQFAFHHFTPSLLLSTDVQSEPRDDLKKATALDPGIAGALTADGEPTLGIVWAEYSSGYLSPKFCYG